MYALNLKKERSKMGIQSPIAQQKVGEENLFLVVSNQKILIMNAKIQKEKYPVGQTLKGYFSNSKKEVLFEIIRVSEYPNDELEYGESTVSVLVEWQNKGTTYPESFDPIDGVSLQVNNHFLINPEANNKPGPPIARMAKITKVHASDFEPFDDDDVAFYSKQAKESTEGNMPIVAVMDTGLKYKWKVKKNTERSFKKNGMDFTFKVARATNDFNSKADFGYCGITGYLQRDPQNLLLRKLNGLTVEKIQLSPYDDNKVNEKLNRGLGEENLNVGRHGSIISAILNEQGCQVLPVKVFNGGGMGTLFDILCGCNYVLACKRGETNIKVLNASFSGSLSPEGRELLFRKMKAMNERDIWVVAAAGNEGIDLDLPENMRYPAQFGLANITGDSTGGLEKVITVGLSNDGMDEPVNTGDPVSVLAKSSSTGGFPSALPIENDALLQGTSFAVPYAAAVLAKAQRTFEKKVDAVKYLIDNENTDVVYFEKP